MRAKSLVLLLLALGCGLVASYGITQAITSRSRAPAGPAEDMAAVIVAVEDISMGDAVPAKAVKLEEWPRARIPPGALGKTEDIEGRRTKTKIYKGSPILDDQLLARGATDGGAPVLIPKGFRVVSVKVDAVSGSASMIRPSDRVDVLVFLAANPSRGITRNCTKIILQNVRVFAVDDKYFLAPDEEGQKSITAKTVSLLVTPQQAEMLTAVSEVGSIHLVMRGLGDSEVVGTPGFAPGELISASSAGDAEKEKELPRPQLAQSDNNLLEEFNKFMNAQQPSQPTTTPVATPARDTWSIRIITGATMNDVVMEPDAATAKDSAKAGFARWKTVSTEAGSPQAPTIPAAAMPAPATPAKAVDAPQAPAAATSGPRDT